jgi:hypothetical protein
MGPLEVYYITIAVIVTLVGLARGYSKELGSTMIILVSIFLILFLQARLDPILLRVRGLVTDEQFLPDGLFLSLFYQLFFISAVFAGYSGRTINFAGRELRPPQGTMLNLLIGALNGYLIAGTLWFYQHAFGYPFGPVGWGVPIFSDMTQSFIALLPQNLLPNPSFWMIPIAVLLLLRVRG